MSNSINLLSWNCHSLYGKLNHFRTNLYKYTPHIVCLSETWLRNDREPVFINYQKYLCNRNQSSGGGIGILVRRDLISNIKILTPFADGNLEIQAVTINSFDKKKL